MQFLDRQAELERLDRLTSGGGLGVVWGRRRVGKTRLLVEWCRRHHGLYTVADQSSPTLQRAAFASALAARFEGFADVTYPDWAAVFRRVTQEAERTGWKGPLVIDELPYLVEGAPELPSVLQRWVDHEAKRSKVVVVIAGSSQRMMQGLVLDANAPLFGRARESFALEPLPAGWAMNAFGVSAPRAIERYAAWGGTPHYWELAASCGTDDLDGQLDRMVLESSGALHLEPSRLLMEEQPPAITLRPLLDAIGLGAHRASEIAGRAGQPATSLHRPLQRLIELGLVQREVPFGEADKNLKRSLYRLSDPFFRLWFRVVAPNRSFLAQAKPAARLALWHEHRPHLVSQTWESLCRQSVARLERGPLAKLGPWVPAQRWWQGNGPEWDVVSSSLDGHHVLLGEVKWTVVATTQADVASAAAALVAKGVPPGLPPKATVHRVVFVPTTPRGHDPQGVTVLDASDVLAALR